MSAAVAEYGRLMGLDGLQTVPHGQAMRMRWADGSMLEFVEHHDELLVCMVFPAPLVSAAELQAALQMQDLQRPENSQGLQVGLRGQDANAMLIAVGRLPARSCSGHDVARVVENGRQWRQRWQAACGRASN